MYFSLQKVTFLQNRTIYINVDTQIEYSKMYNHKTAICKSYMTEYQAGHYSAFYNRKFSESWIIGILLGSP